MRAIWILGLFVFASPIPAQETAPKKPEESEEAKPAEKAPEAPAGPEMDRMSRKLIEEWDAGLYRLGREGVKTASHKVKAKVESMAMGMGMSLEGSATYAWDGEHGSMTWDNAEVATRLAQQGWPQAKFDAPFTDRALTEMFRNAKSLTTTETEEGYVIAVKGVERGPRKIVFDKDGVWQTLVVSAPGQMGGMMEITIDFGYSKVGEKWLMQSQTVSLEIPGMGAYEEKTKFTYTKVGPFHVVGRADATATMGGAPAGSKTIVYTDWKLNDIVQEKPAEAAPAEPKPAEPKKDGDSK